LWFITIGDGIVRILKRGDKFYNEANEEIVRIDGVWRGIKECKPNIAASVVETQDAPEPATPEPTPDSLTEPENEQVDEASNEDAAPKVRKVKRKYRDIQNQPTDPIQDQPVSESSLLPSNDVR
jgi:hypothetical protein